MRLILVLFLFFSSVNTAVAAEKFPIGDFSELLETGTADVVQVIAPDTVVLKDGRILNLAGLDFPDMRGAEGAGPLAQVAMRVLNDMLLGQEVRLYQTPDPKSGRVNRMQHHIAHLERTTDKTWVQGTLISLGLARVRTNVSNPEMAPQLYILEMEARRTAQGIWNSSDYDVLDANAIGEDKLNQYQIVEGIVKNITDNKKRLFINFGDDWRDDFTVVISPENRRRFQGSGIDPLSWKGARVRVRGWLEFYNGPNIEIDHPERVEILKTSP